MAVKPQKNPKITKRSRRPKPVPSSIPRALQKKLLDIEYSKKAHGSVDEDIIFDGKAQPPGYTFVPKGNAYITRQCRSRTHDLDSVVYTVYSSRTHKQTGLYVPTEIYKAVELESEKTEGTRRKAVAQKDALDRCKSKALLFKEFPNMPKVDLDAVLNHAFVKGSRRVGRCGKFANKSHQVRLAVEAHIRHRHTLYDDMIRRGVTRERARMNIWDEVCVLRDSWKN